MPDAGAGRSVVLVVGYGPRGRYWHRLLDSSKRFELAGVVDPDPEALSQARAKGSAAWENLDDALTSRPIHAVVLATPPQSRVPLLLQCLDSVDAVLSEKPLSMSVREAALIAAAADKLGKRVLVCQNFRFLRREVRFAEICKRIGPPRSASAFSARDPSALSIHMRGVDGAAIWDFCIHHLDAFRIRMGGAPVSIYGRAAQSGSLQHIYAHMEWSGERHIFYQHTEGASRYDYFERVEGERGVCYIDDQAVYLRRRFIPRFSVDRLRRFPPPELRVLEELASALAGRDSDLDVADNVATVAMAEALQLSIRSNEAIGLDVVMSDALTTPDGG